MTAHTLTRPTPDEYEAFYAGYISLVPDGDVLQWLEKQRKATPKFLGGIPEATGGHRYAPDKWSIRQLAGHVVDSERVFSYRALSIGRADPAPLPGFDEKAWARTANADERTLKDLVREYGLVRHATVALFRALPAEAWPRRGTANSYSVTVRALAWIIAGHEQHHLRVLRERYL
ncbi:MAG: DinB family protein [Gemmatimonadetes bacterium]|nr:DinB family protein [Gemmatimonadota bacterium]MBI2401376.1 DinB family protein [Gemmatimonadota bacterium]MBI2535439.1 DinB family protein [Gemmatimonadota bacterium]